MKPAPQNNEEDPTCDAVFRALLATGAIVPETVEEVRRAEKMPVSDADALPSDLRDSAAALLRRKGMRETADEKVVPMPVSVYAETLDELRRAARKGDEISTEIEDRMRANRRRARDERQK